MKGRRVICLLCITFVVNFVRGEAMFEDPDSSMCVLPKVELKALEPGIHTTRSSTSRSERSTYQQMKFEVWYDESVTNSSGGDIIMNLTRETVDLISRQLQVKEDSADIIFGRSCATGSYVYNGTEYNCTCGVVTCGTAQLPEHHLQPCLTCKRYENGTEYDCAPEPGGPADRGVSDVHYVLYVTSLAVGSCTGGAIGFASVCYIDLTYNRPITGFINICPRATELLEPEDVQSIIQHEIYHAIGIAPSLYPFFRDQNGDPLTPLGDNGFPNETDDRGNFKWSDRVAQVKTLEWDVRGGQIGRNVTMMVTPNLVREAREYYGCDTIEGVELEDDYGRTGSGSALGHFEARLMPTESMGPAFSKGRQFSRFTLAFLEDTGWYKANYDLADPFTWGRDLGCGFVNQSCKWWMDTQRQRGKSLSPYCENSRELVCSVEGSSASVCNNIKHDEPLPEQYQFFDSLPGYNETEITKVGGGNMFTDHCPVIYPFYSLQTNDYRRQTCDKDIDECASDPCRNGATCSDIITGYFCTCTAGFEGRHCNHSKSVCSTSEQCEQNEVCKDGLCSCGQGRIRIMGGCQIPRRFDMSFVVTEVNSSVAVYPDTLNTVEQQIRGELEYAIFHRLSRWEIFVDSVYSVSIRSFFTESLGVALDIVLDPDSIPDDVTIYNLMTDDLFFAAEDLSSGNTAYILNVSTIVVQDLNECNVTDYSACSVYSTCNNTIGSYQCACLAGFVDQGDAIDGPGTVCIDIDECSNSSLNDCSPFARCDNTPGGYDCSCLSGYVDAGAVSGSSGRLCTDINECISQPCFNGGVCRNFKDRFTCECATGFEGRNCETMIESCAAENLCSQIDHEICSTSALCSCRPGYLRRNGICLAIAIFKGSLSFTSLNGSPLVYTSSLADSSRNGFKQLAQQLRGTLLSVIPGILDVSFTSFRAGSVIGEFDLFVADGTSRDALTIAVMNGIGDGTLLAGQDIVGVDPSSMMIGDLNECVSAELNDCSPVSECTNTAGTFSCACPSGYTDISPAGAGQGRECEQDLVEETYSISIIIIILSIILGILFVLFAVLILILICCHISARKFIKKPYPREIRDDNFLYSNQSVYEHDYHVDNDYPLSYREARDHRTRRDRPVYHDRRGPIRAVSNAVYGFDYGFDQRFVHGFDEGFGRHRFALEYPDHHRPALEYPVHHRPALESLDHHRPVSEYPDQHRSDFPNTIDVDRKQHLMYQRQPRVYGAQTNPRNVPY